MSNNKHYSNKKLLREYLYRRCRKKLKDKLVSQELKFDLFGIYLLTKEREYNYIYKDIFVFVGN